MNGQCASRCLESSIPENEAISGVLPVTSVSFDEIARQQRINGGICRSSSDKLNRAIAKSTSSSFKRFEASFIIHFHYFG